MILRHQVDLQDSFAHWGQPDFEDVLVEELHLNSHNIPLQTFCREGGWPDDDSLKLEIATISEEKSGIVVVEVGCLFTEIVPSSCAEITMPRKRSGAFEVVLDIRAEAAFIPEDTDG